MTFNQKLFNKILVCILLKIWNWNCWKWDLRMLSLEKKSHLILKKLIGFSGSFRKKIHSKISWVKPKKYKKKALPKKKILKLLLNNNTMKNKNYQVTNNWKGKENNYYKKFREWTKKKIEFFNKKDVLVNRRKGKMINYKKLKGINNRSLKKIIFSLMTKINF